MNLWCDMTPNILVSIGSCNGMVSCRHHALLTFGTLEGNLSEIWNKIQQITFQNVICKMSAHLFRCQQAEPIWCDQSIFVHKPLQLLGQWIMHYLTMLEKKKIVMSNSNYWLLVFKCFCLEFPNQSSTSDLLSELSLTWQVTLWQ